jgi:hypothetical protein
MNWFGLRACFGVFEEGEYLVLADEGRTNKINKEVAA